MDTAVEPNLLVVSDLHLGSDLQEIHSTSALRGLAQLDRDLGAFLDYYLGHREGGRPWRLVIAGDLVDFIGMAIRPAGGEQPRTSLTPEEVENGLGSAADHEIGRAHV